MELELSWEELDDDLSKEFQKEFSSDTPGPEIRVFPSGMVFPAVYTERANIIHRLPIRQDDTFVVSFPKCGEVTAFCHC